MKKVKSFLGKYVVPYIGWAVVIFVAGYMALSFGQAIVGGYMYYHHKPTTVTTVAETKKPAPPSKCEEKKDTKTAAITDTATSTTQATCHFAWIDNEKGTKSIRLWQYFGEERRWVAEIKPGDRYGLKEPLDFKYDFLKVYTEEDGREGIYHNYYFFKKIPTEQSWDGRSQQ